MQLFFKPVGDVRKHLGFVRLHQQFMAGAGVEFRLDVPDTGVPEALDGPPGKRRGRSFGTPARTAGSYSRRMPVNML